MGTLNQIPTNSNLISMFQRDKSGTLSLLNTTIQSLLLHTNISTPVYIYNLDAIQHVAHRMQIALKNKGFCAYAIKANHAGPIVQTLRTEGCGVDAVSIGELKLALTYGISPHQIVYSGVAKRDDELDFAIHTGILGIHVESIEELKRITARAKALNQSRVAIAVRINPSVEVQTHSYIATGHDEAKFGISLNDLPYAFQIIQASNSNLSLVGLSTHVGSQLMQTEEYLSGLRSICDLAKYAISQGFSLQYIDAGGGFGTAYRNEEAPADPAITLQNARNEMDRVGLSHLQLIAEPGRALVAPYGLLVTRVIQTKISKTNAGIKRWLFIDAGMNDLIRPALYQAYHRIEPIEISEPSTQWPIWRVAGPVCESSDDFGEHLLPEVPPDLLIVRDVGAYGRSMASTYNMRPIASEIFVSCSKIYVHKANELEELIAMEQYSSYTR